MTYELAKQLKDAGFPQKGEYFWWKIHGDISKNAWNLEHSIDNAEALIRGYCDVVLSPTLSELIEACGKITLVGLEGVDWQAQGGKLKLNNKTMQGGYEIYAQGSTPEESVAKLWLALHIKE